jgi:SAM-dependent methyltransferase
VNPIFAKRVAHSYQLQNSRFEGHKGGFWDAINDRNSDIDLLLNGDDFNKLATILSDPVKTELFYGMDVLYSSSDHFSPETAPIELINKSIYFLGEATGAIGLANPEGGGARIGDLALEDLLVKIEQITEIPIDFPNPFAGEVGIPSTRGIISHRAILSIYQAWRTLNLTRKYGKRVLEIGGGSGRAAYYARRAGILDYTIVDIPMTSVAQATWLGETIGSKNIALLGEEQRADAVKLADQRWLNESNKSFDVVVNVDSMTEMALPVALEYEDYIVSSSKVFLSINHEINSFRVWDLPKLKDLMKTRNYCWIRPGYAEEIFEINSLKLTPPNGLLQSAYMYFRDLAKKK